MNVEDFLFIKNHGQTQHTNILFLLDDNDGLVIRLHPVYHTLRCFGSKHVQDSGGRAYILRGRVGTWSKLCSGDFWKDVDYMAIPPVISFLVDL